MRLKHNETDEKKKAILSEQVRCSGDVPPLPRCTFSSAGGGSLPALRVNPLSSPSPCYSEARVPVYSPCTALPRLHPLVPLPSIFWARPSSPASGDGRGEGNPARVLRPTQLRAGAAAGTASARQLEQGRRLRIEGRGTDRQFVPGRST